MHAIKSSALIISFSLGSSLSSVVGGYSLEPESVVLLLTVLFSKLIILERDAFDSNPAWSILDLDKLSASVYATVTSIS